MPRANPNSRTNTKLESSNSRQGCTYTNFLFAARRGFSPRQNEPRRKPLSDPLRLQFRAILSRLKPGPTRAPFRRSPVLIQVDCRCLIQKSGFPYTIAPLYECEMKVGSQETQGVWKVSTPLLSDKIRAAQSFGLSLKIAMTGNGRHAITGNGQK